MLVLMSSPCTVHPQPQTVGLPEKVPKSGMFLKGLNKALMLTRVLEIARLDTRYSCHLTVHHCNVSNTGKEIGSLFETQLPVEEDGTPETSWETAAQPIEGAPDKEDKLFQSGDVLMTNTTGDIEIDCSSVQNSPHSNSSIHDMSLDEFET